MESAEGVQQEDPLGPLLFCVTIHQLTMQLNSDFNIFYLDDGTLGGDFNSVLHDLKMVETTTEQLGLWLKKGKSEIICWNLGTFEKFLSVVPGLQVTSPKHATLFGSPLSEFIKGSILDKVNFLKVLRDRISYLSAQEAILLLCSSLAIPRLNFLLRTAPSYQSPQLKVRI